jgi:hypothetical protein
VCQADAYKYITGTVLNKDKIGGSFIKITEYIAKYQLKIEDRFEVK